MLIVSGSYQNYQKMGLRVLADRQWGKSVLRGAAITVDFATAA